MTESERREWGRLRRAADFQAMANVEHNRGNKEKAADYEVLAQRSYLGEPLISEEEMIHQSMEERSLRRGGFIV